jgi:hypothetical protein
MRLHIGPIPDSPEFVPDGTWTVMREPSPWVMQLLALPFGAILSIALAVAWFSFTPLGQAPPPSAGELFGVLIAMVPAHEALHVAVHPRTGHSILGFWPSRLLFYTHYHAELRCRRFLAILLAPLAVISLLPLVLCAASATSSAAVGFASVSNALFASGDLLAAGLVAWQIPRTATLRNKGWRVYWRCDTRHRSQLALM